MFRFSALSVALGLLCIANTPAVGAAAPPVFSPHPSVGWVAILGGLKPPKSGPGPVKDDPAHPTIDNNQFRLTGKQPTLPVADLRNPILQPWVREALRKRNERVLAGEPVFGPRQSCWPRGVPGFLNEGGFQPMFIIQSAKEVIMVAQADNHQLRHIYLDVPHSKTVKPSWYGESVGRYEGDTLVVDTIGLNTKTVVDNFRTPHTEKLHVVERFTLNADRNTLTAIVTVDDPDTFNAALTMQQRWTKVNEPMGESICAENNFDFFSQNLFPVPMSEKPDF